jgi:hypothetical protein
MEPSNHTFSVFVFGGYYKDDVEFTVDIPLSDDELATIQNLVSRHQKPNNQNLAIFNSQFSILNSHDLMPILKAGAPELHKRFFDAIYPRVFFELFDIDHVDPKPGDWGRQWDFERDIDYMLATYGDAIDVSDAFVCRIPDHFIQKNNKKQ